MNTPLGNQQNMEETFVSFTSDYGFKVTFGNETDTRFLRRALQALICSPNEIVQVEFEKNDFVGLTHDSRSGVYDLVCTDDKQNTFIVEMQVAYFPFFMERMKFYAFHKFNMMVQKGKYKFDNIKHIYCIGILSHNIFQIEEYHNIGKLTNQTGMIMDEKLTYITAELDKFNLTEAEVTTDLDKLLFTMKNLQHYATRPPIEFPQFWTEDWLKVAIEELDIRHFTAEQLMHYSMTMVNNTQAVSLVQAQVDAAQIKGLTEGRTQGLSEGRTQGLSEGRTEGRTETNRNAVLKALEKNKLTIEEIADYNDVSLDFVLKIQAELFGK